MTSVFVIASTTAPVATTRQNLGPQRGVAFSEGKMKTENL